MKSSFLIYLDYKEQFELLSDEELGQLLRAIMLYEETGEITELRPSQITSLMLERDYDTDHLPVILISLSLQNDISIENDTSIHLKIDKIIGEEDKGIVQVMQKSEYINEIMSFIVLDDTPSSSYFENILYSKQERKEVLETVS